MNLIAKSEKYEFMGNSIFLGNPTSAHSAVLDCTAQWVGLCKKTHCAVLGCTGSGWVCVKKLYIKKGHSGPDFLCFGFINSSG